MKREILYEVATAVLALSVVYVALHAREKHVDAAIVSPVLGPDDRAKIVLDPKSHRVTRVDNEGLHTTYLNPHGPVSITEKKDGTVSMAQRTYGTIHEPNFGAAFGSDFKIRTALGVNLFYVQRWELGGGLLVNPSQIKDLRLYAAVGYNVYDNWLISAGVDNHRAVHLIASVRL